MRQHCVFRSKRRIGISLWPRGVRLGSTAARLLGLWVRIPLWTWMSVSCECCVLQVEVSASERSLVQRSSTECCVSECDREASVMRMPWPTKRLLGLWEGKSGIVYNKQCTLPAYEQCGLAVAHAYNGTNAAWLTVMCLQIKMFIACYVYPTFAVGCDCPHYGSTWREFSHILNCNK
jgi:hypothetical protein